jgi:ribonuclease Z
VALPTDLAPRRLVVLGTASQVPTATRNHNGYLLRWDGEGVLFDPGEGTQRQFTRLGLPASCITRICLTHFHGDHCLGLPGVVQRLALDGASHPVPVHFPASGGHYYERLVKASAFAGEIDLRPEPLPASGAEIEAGPLRLIARPLAHGIDVLGYRLVEPDRRTFEPARLAALGIEGAAVGRLEREGSLIVAGRRVTVEEVSHLLVGQVFALVLDTGPTPAIDDLVAGADLAVIEATYLSAEGELAARHGHLTAAQAGRLAARGRVRKLVLTHYSARYDDVAPFAVEAGEHHDDVIAARDGDVVALPRRTRDLHS